MPKPKKRLNTQHQIAAVAVNIHLYFVIYTTYLWKCKQNKNLCINNN